jgi:hypothetical protein
METVAYLLLGWCISGFIDDILSGIRLILGNELLLGMWSCVVLRCYMMLRRRMMLGHG